MGALEEPTEHFRETKKKKKKSVLRVKDNTVFKKKK